MHFTSSSGNPSSKAHHQSLQVMQLSQRKRWKHGLCMCFLVFPSHARKLQGVQPRGQTPMTSSNLRPLPKAPTLSSIIRYFSSLSIPQQILDSNTENMRNLLQPCPTNQSRTRIQYGCPLYKKIAFQMQRHIERRLHKDWNYIATVNVLLEARTEPLIRPNPCDYIGNTALWQEELHSHVSHL